MLLLELCIGEKPKESELEFLIDTVQYPKLSNIISLCLRERRNILLVQKDVELKQRRRFQFKPTSKSKQKLKLDIKCMFLNIEIDTQLPENSDNLLGEIEGK